MQKQAKVIGNDENQTVVILWKVATGRGGVSHNGNSPSSGFMI
jgi:hypothetical protein